MGAWSERQESNLLLLAPKASRLPLAYSPKVPGLGLEPRFPSGLEPPWAVAHPPRIPGKKTPQF